MRLNQFVSTGACAFVFILTSTAAAQSTVLAQDSLRAVRELYASAAYEDALAALGKLEASAEILDQTAEYRVYCLVALGRMNEASEAVEGILMGRPEYKPDPSAASPRILTLFSEVRQRIAPGLVKKMYQEARAAMDRKDREDAILGFEATIRLAGEPELRDNATVAELKELGAGFLELSRAIPPKPVVPEVAAPATVASRTHVIVPPKIIQQRLPRWVPRTGNRNADYQGAVRVQISAEGRVVDVELLKSVHPAYDQQLLRAARGWLYEPAQKDGVSIPIDKTVEVKIAPASGADSWGDKSQPF